MSPLTTGPGRRRQGGRGGNALPPPRLGSEEPGNGLRAEARGTMKEAAQESGSSMVTVGFEIERFDFPTNLEKILKRTGLFYDFHQDGSGPYECSSEPFPLNAEKPPEQLILPTIYWVWSLRSMQEDNRSASTHYHIYISAFDDNEIETIVYDILPSLAMFFAAGLGRTVDNSIRIQFTRNREYWAGFNYDLENRSYYMVTYNPDHLEKPATWEFRLCETSPLLCHAGLYIIHNLVRRNKISSITKITNRILKRTGDKFPGYNDVFVYDKETLAEIRNIVNPIIADAPYYIAETARIVLNPQRYTDPRDLTNIIKRVVQEDIVKTLITKYSVHRTECRPSGRYVELIPGFEVEVCANEELVVADFGQHATKLAKMIHMKKKEDAIKVIDAL